MSSEIIVALLSLAGTFFGTFSGIKLMSYRIEQLEKKVEALSGLVERIAVMENKIITAEHRLSRIERSAVGTGYDPAALSEEVSYKC